MAVGCFGVLLGPVFFGARFGALEVKRFGSMGRLCLKTRLQDLKVPLFIDLAL